MVTPFTIRFYSSFGILFSFGFIWIACLKYYSLLWESWFYILSLFDLQPHSIWYDKVFYLSKFHCTCKIFHLYNLYIIYSPQMYTIKWGFRRTNINIFLIKTIIRKIFISGISRLHNLMIRVSGLITLIIENSFCLFKLFCVNRNLRISDRSFYFILFEVYPS